jgi:protein-tyrosine phosphatase
VSTKPPIGVLFVCTGNICRSPTAEAVFRRMVEEAGLAQRFTIASAGTHVWYHEGEPADNRAQAAARRRGYDLSAIRARLLQKADFTRFDWFIAMDEGHYQILRREASQTQRHRVRLMREFAQSQPGRDIPDPYLGSADGFEHALDLIEEASRGLLDRLIGENPAA